MSKTDTLLHDMNMKTGEKLKSLGWIINQNGLCQRDVEKRIGDSSKAIAV